MQHSFRYLFAGQTLANLGDVLLIVAAVSLVYEVTGNALGASMIPLVRVGAMVLSGFLAPVVMERYKLTRLLVGTQLAQTLLVAGMTLTANTQTGHAILYIFLAFLAGLSFLHGWLLPVRNSLLPRLVDEARLVKANGLLATTDQTLQLAGWAAGGVIVAYLGGTSVLWGTAGLYLLAVLSLSRVQDSTGETASNPPPKKQHAIKQAWRFVFRQPQLRVLLTMQTLEDFANGVWIGAIMLVYVDLILGQGEPWWGFLNAGFLAGSIASGLLVFALSQWVHKNLRATMIYGIFTAGLLTLVFALTSNSWLALAVVILHGLPFQVHEIAKRTAFQQSAAMSDLPKVFSVQGTLGTITFGLAVVLMAAVTDTFGVRTAYIVSAALCVLSAGLAAWKLNLAKTDVSV